MVKQRFDPQLLAKAVILADLLTNDNGFAHT
jgi:hypothetical protein